MYIFIMYKLTAFKLIQIFCAPIYNRGPISGSKVHTINKSEPDHNICYNDIEDIVRIDWHYIHRKVINARRWTYAELS